MGEIAPAGIRTVWTNTPIRCPAGSSTLRSARAIVTRPALVLARPPALDSRSARMLLERLEELNQIRGHHSDGDPRRLHRQLLPPGDLPAGRADLPGTGRGGMDRQAFFAQIIRVVSQLGRRWKMFSKLALRNVRRSFRDYGVYLLTLTFGVCLFYTFNSIDGQGGMVYLVRAKPHGPGDPDRSGYSVRLCGGCAGLFDPIAPVPHPPRSRSWGPISAGPESRAVSAAGPGRWSGLVSLAAGCCWAGGLPGYLPSLCPCSPSGGRLRPGLLPSGSGAHSGLFRPDLSARDGVQRHPGVPARLIDLMQGSGKMRSCREAPGAGGGPVRAGAVCLAARLCHPADLWHGHRCGGPAHLCGHAVPGHPGHSADL